MAEKIRLSEALGEYEMYRKSLGRAEGTRRNELRAIRRFIGVNGDLFVSSSTETHVTKFFVSQAVTRSENSLAIDYAALSTFFAWAIRMRYIGRFDNPMDGRKAPPPREIEKSRVPMAKFPALLDAAEKHHRRDRMVIALGLYLFLRGGEIATLKIGAVDLDSGEIRVAMHKTREQDVMPISAELDVELRSWLTYYAEECGTLDPDWYLVPAKRPHSGTYDRETRRFVRTGCTAGAPLNPTRPITRIQEVAHRALQGIGHQTRDATGKPLNEGMHTLRRSGARATFDVLETRGYDGAIRHVQTMLHHKKMAMTEHYLGLTLDRVKRNDLVRGQRMYDFGENVVALRSVSGGTNG